jgi:hypothetical protein
MRHDIHDGSPLHEKRRRVVQPEEGLNLGEELYNFPSHRDKPGGSVSSFACTSLLDAFSFLRRLSKSNGREKGHQSHGTPT